MLEAGRARIEVRQDVEDHVGIRLCFIVGHQRLQLPFLRCIEPQAKCSGHLMLQEATTLMLENGLCRGHIDFPLGQLTHCLEGLASPPGEVLGLVPHVTRLLR